MELCQNVSKTAESIKEAKATCTCSIHEAKVLCSMVSRDAEALGASRLTHSNGDMSSPIQHLEEQAIQRGR